MKSAILVQLWMFIGFCLPGLITPAFASTPAENKRVVSAFYDLAFNQHQPAEAMKQYVGSRYTQHNPFVADGKQPFIDFFTGFFKKNPKARADLKRLIAEGDRVVVHVHSRLNDTDPGRAVMDIFRLESGKIVEHWDVGMPIPAKAANENGMF